MKRGWEQNSLPSTIQDIPPLYSGGILGVIELNKVE